MALQRRYGDLFIKKRSVLWSLSIAKVHYFLWGSNALLVYKYTLKCVLLFRNAINYNWFERMCLRMIDMELGPIRPPSEAESLMLRVTRGCHWNKCYFCDLYKKYKFSRRRYEEIEEDLKKAADSEYAQNYTTCFLQDGDAFVLQTEFLMQILEGIHKYLPNINM